MNRKSTKVAELPGDADLYMQFSFLAYVSYEMKKVSPLFKDAIAKREGIANSNETIKTYGGSNPLQGESLKQFKKFNKTVTQSQKEWIEDKIAHYRSPKPPTGPV